MNGQDLALTKKLIDKYGGGTVSDSQLNSAIDKKIADGTIASGEQLESNTQQLQEHLLNHPSGSGGDLNKIQILDQEPIGGQLYEGRIWLIKSPDLTCKDISLSTNNLNIVGNTQQNLTYALTPSNTTDEVSLSILPEGICVFEDGVVYPIGNGNCVITVNCGDKSVSCNVTVSGYVGIPSRAGVFTMEQNGVTSNINFTLSNGAMYDNVKKCYSFTGTNKYITTNDFMINDAISIEFYLEDFSKGNTVICEPSNWTSSNHFTIQADLINSIQTLLFRVSGVNTDGKHTTINNTTPVKHHIIMCLDANGKYYFSVDGVVSTEKTNNQSGNLINTVKSLYLGSRKGQYGATCNIYSLRIYDRLLTSMECIVKYNQIKSS